MRSIRQIKYDALLILSTLQMDALQNRPYECDKEKFDWND